MAALIKTQGISLDLKEDLLNSEASSAMTPCPLEVPWLGHQKYLGIHQEALPTSCQTFSDLCRLFKGEAFMIPVEVQQCLIGTNLVS